MGYKPLCLLLLVLALIGGGCRSASQTRPSNPSVADQDESGVVHVHGLGINPTDNALYAATHTGLFRIPEQGKAARVADRFQDLMGFTVVGPDHFLGSGHPDMRDYQAKRLPALLGLIESRDAGRTWRPLSLLGEADFHVLRAAHGRIYGFDSTGGALMVSSDGTTWETRAKVVLRDFVVSPADPEVIVAAMANDVRRSDDGGRSWEPVSAPPLVLLAWPRENALWGLTGRGALFVSEDGGRSWQQRGMLAGAPDAFLAHGDMLYVSLHQGGIHLSEDGGTTWRVRYREPA